MDQRKQPQVSLSAAVGVPRGTGAQLPVVAQHGPGAASTGSGAGIVPGQRSADARPDRGSPEEGGRADTAGRRPGGRLRVDARRNLESVLRAAREVFGELGYGAPMEEVARRAGVGVGTVYRRFPSKEVLVRRIASEEVTWLTAQAREALYGEPDPWEALAGYLARAVTTGAGRLLPPEAVRHAERLSRERPEHRESDRVAWPVDPGPFGGAPGADLAAEPGRPVEGERDDADPAALLELLAALVDRADAAGALRPGVTVADVVLVLTAAVPPCPPSEPGLSGSQEPRSDRLLRILLNGLREH